MSQNYRENKAQYIAYIEAASGLGLIIGPPMGSAIYGVLGYGWAFYSFSILAALNLMQVCYFIPNKIN